MKKNIIWSFRICCQQDYQNEFSNFEKKISWNCRGILKWDIKNTLTPLYGYKWPLNEGRTFHLQSIVMTHQLATWNVSTSHFLGRRNALPPFVDQHYSLSLCWTATLRTSALAATTTPCFLTFTILIYCCHTSFSVSFFIIKRKLFSCKANVYIVSKLLPK